MADSLREQLLKSGLVKRAPAGRAKAQAKRKRKPRSEHTPQADDRHNEMDLGRAWAMRSRSEASERKQARAQAEADARARKERMRHLGEVLAGRALNKPDVECVRHFEYHGRIRRVYVDAGQLEQLNDGRLGVVQHQGRYVVVPADLAAKVCGFAPEHVALLVDPDAPVADDDVPDDLMW